MTTARAHAIAVGVASAQALGPNARRTALFISVPAAGTVSLAFGEAAVLNAGLTTVNPGIPLVITEDMMGEAIHQPVFTIGSGATTLGILEMYVQ